MDWFNIITLVSSIVAVLVSLFSWRAAIHANRSALFERRFEVYTDAEKFILAWGVHARPDENLIPVLVKAWNRSHFLFEPEVTQHLQKIWYDAVSALELEYAVNGEVPGDRREARDKLNKLTREHTEIAALRNAFLPHLKVSDGYLSLPKWPRFIREFIHPKRPWLTPPPSAQ